MAFQSKTWFRDNIQNYLATVKGAMPSDLTDADIATGTSQTGGLVSPFQLSALGGGSTGGCNPIPQPFDVTDPNVISNPKANERCVYTVKSDYINPVVNYSIESRIEIAGNKEVNLHKFTVGAFRSLTDIIFRNLDLSDMPGLFTGSTIPEFRNRDMKVEFINCKLPLGIVLVGEADTRGSITIRECDTTKSVGLVGWGNVRMINCTIEDNRESDACIYMRDCGDVLLENVTTIANPSILNSSVSSLRGIRLDNCRSVRAVNVDIRTAPNAVFSACAFLMYGGTLAGRIEMQEAVSEGLGVILRGVRMSVFSFSAPSQVYYSSIIACSGIIEISRTYDNDDYASPDRVFKITRGSQMAGTIIRHTGITLDVEAGSFWG